MGGGAWPFLVGGVICLVNSVNERDLNLLNSYENIAIKAMLRWVPVKGRKLRCSRFYLSSNFLEGLFVSNKWKFEAITGL